MPSKSVNSDRCLRRDMEGRVNRLAPESSGAAKPSGTKKSQSRDIERAISLAQEL